MAAVTVRAVDGNMRPRRDGHTIVLVVHPNVLDGHVVAARDVEAVAVVRGRLSLAQLVRRVAVRVVERQVRDRQVLVARHAEEVDGPVLDVQVSYE